MRLFLPLLTASVLFGWVAACNQEDLSNPLRTRPVTVNNATAPSDDDDDDDPGGQNGLVGDSGTSSPDDASTKAESGQKPPSDPGAFLGAPAYVATVGATTRKPQHNFAGNTPTTNPAGQACLQCHGAAGPAPRFGFAGTIYKDTAGTKPASSVQVRIIDANNKALATFTDADGNFFIPFATSGAIAFPVKGGARDADTTKLMKGTATNGNCNSCHRAGGASTPLAVP
jgi:mono/diheme cytochrome c family protein